MQHFNCNNAKGIALEIQGRRQEKKGCGWGTLLSGSKIMGTFDFSLNTSFFQKLKPHTTTLWLFVQYAVFSFQITVLQTISHAMQIASLFKF